jgi:maltose O-acetyltransferase
MSGTPNFVTALSFLARYIGDGAFLNFGVLIDTVGGVWIGENCRIGPRVNILTSTHVVGSTEQRGGELSAQPVRIEDGAWVGAGSLIMPGVSVARGCVVAAGAVVTSDTTPDGLYAGVPATRRRDLEVL